MRVGHGHGRRRVTALERTTRRAEQVPPTRGGSLPWGDTTRHGVVTPVTGPGQAALIVKVMIVEVW